MPASRISRKPCNWHNNGVPTWAIGKKFFVKGCPKCEEKKAKGLVKGDEGFPTEARSRTKALIAGWAKSGHARKEAQKKDPLPKFSRDYRRS